MRVAYVLRMRTENNPLLKYRKGKSHRMWSFHNHDHYGMISSTKATLYKSLAFVYPRRRAIAMVIILALLRMVCGRYIKKKVNCSGTALSGNNILDNVSYLMQ
jgi:hypothetical protein